MVNLGEVNTLHVSRLGPYGTYLDGGDDGEVMLLKAKPAKNHAVGDALDVFVFVDTDDTLVASLTHPNITRGQVGCLEVVALTRDGAFLDWGMRSDLFVPRTEQMGEMRVGSRCVALALVDKVNHRMIGSTRLHRHLPEENHGTFVEGQEVALTICQITDLGFKAVIDNSHLGMLYRGEVFRDLRVGTRTTGYLKAARDDHKIDLVLQKAGKETRNRLETQILDHLKAKGGSSHLTDKSPPEEIYRVFAVSKKAYKQAIGGLYRSRLIVLSKTEIRLAENDT